MTDSYPIYQLTAEMKAMSDLSVEREGMLEKAWFVHPELGDCLFKKSAPGGREIVGCQTDWSEKITFELAQLLDIPAARYELAQGDLTESDRDLVRGSISCSYILAGGEAISGEAFLSEIYPTFDHGKALGATMSEVTRDRMSVESYNRFLESGFWRNNRKISTFTAFEIAAALYPDVAKIWIERLIQMGASQ